MTPPAPFLQRHAVAAFCTLTVLLSYACYLLPVPRGEPLQIVLVLVPTLVAVLIVSLSEGGAGVRALLGQAFRWRISLKWLAVSLAAALGMRLAVSLLGLALGMIPRLQVRPVPPGGLALLAGVLLVAAVLEEIGWRGYALARLLKTQPPLAASLVIGVLWGAIHFSLHLPGMAFEGISLIPTLIQLVSLSVLITWIFTGSGSRVVLPAIFHAAQSFFIIFNDGLGIAQQAWLMAGVWAAAALIAVLASRSMRSFAAPGPSRYAPGAEEAQA